MGIEQYPELKNLTFDQLDGLLRAPMAAYTPTHNMSNLGTGSLMTATYKRVGNMLDLNVSVYIGNSPSLSGSEWFIQLPSGMIAAGGPDRYQTGAVWCLDAGVAYRTGTAVIAGTGNSFGIASHGGGNYWNSTVPHTWGATDRFGVSMRIEIL